MPDDQQISPAEFAKRIKDQYPQYLGRSDDELVSARVAKYPQYKSRIKFPEKVQRDGPLPSADPVKPGQSYGRAAAYRNLADAGVGFAKKAGERLDEAGKS